MKQIIQLLCGPPGLIALGAFIAAIGALWASQKEAQFERDLRAKSEEIADLNREIANLVTGGDSFCYVSIANLNPSTNRGILVVVHKGDYPIFDLSIRMLDLQKFGELEEYTLASMNQAATILPIGTLPKENVVTVGEFDLGSSPERDFNIFFTTRNSHFTQSLRLRKIDDKWLKATKVERDGKVIHEHTDEGMETTRVMEETKDETEHAVWKKVNPDL